MRLAISKGIDALCVARCTGRAGSLFHPQTDTCKSQHRTRRLGACKLKRPASLPLIHDQPAQKLTPCYPHLDVYARALRKRPYATSFVILNGGRAPLHMSSDPPFSQ